MTIEENKIDNGIMLKISGKIGTEEAPHFKKKIDELIEKEKINIIIDVNKTEYICSMGLGVLLNLFKELSPSNKKLIIINSNSEVDEIFKTTKMSEIINIVPDKAAAMSLID